MTEAAKPRKRLAKKETPKDKVDAPLTIDLSRPRGGPVQEEEESEEEYEFENEQEILDAEREALREMNERFAEEGLPDRSDLYPVREEMDRGKKIGLIKEYKSFDHLWYDIETRVKSVIEDLQKPVYDEMLENTMRCKTMEKVHK